MIVYHFLYGGKCFAFVYLEITLQRVVSKRFDQVTVLVLVAAGQLLFAIDQQGTAATDTTAAAGTKG
jgi:hypothetical protein